MIHISRVGRERSLNSGQIVLTNERGILKFSGTLDGVVAQLVEHHNGIVGVRGSNPLGSTILNINHLR